MKNGRGELTAVRSAAVFFLFVLCLLPCLSYSADTVQERVEKSVAFGAEGHFKESREELKKSLAINPFHTSAQLYLKVVEDVLNGRVKREAAVLLFKGEMLLREADYGKAIGEYDRAITIEPDYAVFYMKRGTVYTRQGMHANGTSDYDRAIKIEPDYPLFYITRGIGNAKKGDYETAITDYNRAIEIDPADADAFYNRGVANAKRGRHVLAILDYDRAIEINPKYANAYTNRGFVYLMVLENKEKGCSDWERACKLGMCANISLAQKDGHCK